MTRKLAIVRYSERGVRGFNISGSLEPINKNKNKFEPTTYTHEMRKLYTCIHTGLLGVEKCWRFGGCPLNTHTPITNL